MVSNHTTIIKSIIIIVGFMIALLHPNNTIGQCRTFTLEDLERFAELDGYFAGVLKKAGYRLNVQPDEEGVKTMYGLCGDPGEITSAITIQIVPNPVVSLQEISKSYLEGLLKQMTERNYKLDRKNEKIAGFSNDKFAITIMMTSDEKRIYGLLIKEKR